MGVSLNRCCKPLAADEQRSAARADRLQLGAYLTLDDELLAEAQRLTGTKEKTVLVREALRALIERESARRLARLGGTEPGLTVAPRRRSAAA